VDYHPLPSDIRESVLPYFEHIEAGMNAARGAWLRDHGTCSAPVYVVGVYGNPAVIQALTSDPKCSLPRRPFVWLALPEFFLSPDEPALYEAYWRRREWAIWQIGVTPVVCRKGDPTDGFDCDVDEMGKAPNGSFVIK
jgi:hypothetical protein